MHMRHFKSSFWILAGILSISSISAKALDLSAVSGLNFAGTTTTPSNASALQSVNGTSAVNTGYPIGALVGMSPAHNWDLETGLVYSTNVTSNTANAPDQGFVGVTTDTYHYLQIPVVARYRIFPYLGIGGGFYYGHAVGQVSETDTSGTGMNGTKSWNGSLNSANLKDDDYGAVFSLRGAYPLIKGISAMVDARFLLGLKNDSTTTEVSRYRAAQFLAGVSFDLDRLAKHSDASELVAR